MLSRSLLLLGVAAGLAAAAESHEKHHQGWLYGEVDGRGPSNWKDLEGNGDCKKNEQSPINIHGAAVDRGLKPLEMHYSEAVGFSLTNTQHSVKLVPKNGDGNYVLDQNNGGKRYNLAQMHFHSPSEHGIGGGLFDMELHLVHTLAEADAGEKYQYLVVGVLFRAGSTPNELLNFFSDLPSVPLADFENYGNASAEYEYGVVTMDSARFNFEALVGGKGFYKYSGSFTTPPCTEGVAWHVMHDVNVVSGAQLQAFRTAMGFERELEVAHAAMWDPSAFQYFGNNRPVMPLGSRTVRVFSEEASDTNGNDDDDDDDDDEHSTAWKLGVAAVVLGSVAIILALAALFAGMGSAKAASANEPVTEEEAPKAEPVTEEAAKEEA